MEPGHDACSHEASFHHVALPVYVAYHPAFPKGPAACEEGVAPFGGYFGENECPGPACRSVARGIGPIPRQGFFIFGRTDRLLVRDERTETGIMFLGSTGGRARVIEASTQQRVKDAAYPVG